MQSVEIENLAKEILEANQSDETGIYAQRARVEELWKKLQGVNTAATETAHSATQSNQISNQVSDMARVLKKEVDQFTV